jgi:hypothetical protein
MGYWNHRIIKEVCSDGAEMYSIRETFYNDDGSIYAYTEKPADLECESVEELQDYIDLCVEAFNSPILVDGEVEFKDPEDNGVQTNG